MPLWGEVAALITAVLWSGTAIAFSEASIRAGSLTVNITRMTLASTFLIITIFIAGLSFNLSSTQVINLSISGLIGLIFGDGFLFKAFQLIGARLSMLIMSLAPPIATVLAYFFLNEQLSIWAILGIIITIGGVAMVVLQRHEEPSGKFKINALGILYGIFGALGQGAGLILAKMAFNEGEINGFVATFVRVFSAVIVIIPMAIVTRTFKNPIKIYSHDKKAFGFTLIGSVLGPYLGITFSLIAISNTQVGIASTLMATVPILMLPLVRFYYKEKLSWISIIGAVIAVGGVAILFLK
ncbi:MAG: DMT family transporter [bacterium]